MNPFLGIVLFLLLRRGTEIPSEAETTASSSTTPPRATCCPHCGSHHLIKNGSIHNGKPKRLCKDCSKQFVDAPQNQPVSSTTKQLVDALLLERISLREIARVTAVRGDWLQPYVNQKMASIPRQVKVSAKSRGRLTIACDEMWSFVERKKIPFISGS